MPPLLVCNRGWVSNHIYGPHHPGRFETCGKKGEMWEKNDVTSFLKLGENVDIIIHCKLGSIIKWGYPSDFISKKPGDTLW